MRNLSAAIIASAFVLSGCLPDALKDNKDAVGQPKTANVTATTSSLSSVAAFQETVYPIARARCTTCHIGTNQPFFASENVIASHDALIQQAKVDFNDPAGSRLVDRLLRDMHHCWSSCSADAEEMRAAITSWKTKMAQTPTNTGGTTNTGGGTTNTGGGTTTPPPPTTPTIVRMNTVNMLIPATLPRGGDAATQFVTLRWPLDANNDSINPNVTGAVFQVEIQLFDDYSYRIRNPRIINPSSAVYVMDVRFAINGMIRMNDATYSLVDRIVPASTGGTVLSTSPLISLLDKGPGIDQLAVSFVKVNISGTAGCKNLAGFVSMVKPVLASTTCSRCHNAGNAFNVTGADDATLCNRALGRADLVVPANSTLVTKPYQGLNHGGGGNLINATTAMQWINWVTSEK